MVMKHIREYATYDYEVEDLVDYLQEVFDKLSIRHVSTAMDGDMRYSFFSNQTPPYGKSIAIKEIPENKAQDVYNELRFAQPLIEKRLGKHIIINVYGIHDLNKTIHIKIGADVIWESKRTPIPLYNKLDDLSDYLQEVFDKFNIPQNERSSPTLFTWYIWVDSIFIINIPSKIVSDIDDELERVKPMVEKRLGDEITIFTQSRTSHQQALSYIRISIETNNYQLK